MMRLIIPTLISLITINLSTAPAHATSNDYVVLESITVVNNEIQIGENLEFELEVSAPKNFLWSPLDSNIDGKLSILLCGDFIYDQDLNDCNYSNQQSKFQLRNVSNISSSEIGNFIFYRFTVYGVPVTNQAGQYFPYLIKLVRTSVTSPDFETHYYYFNNANPTDGFTQVASITTPEFQSKQITVTDPNSIVPEPDPEPEPIIESTPEPVIEETLDPAAPSTTNQTPISQQVIQSNFYLPALKGDENWKPMKEIKGNFQDWKRIKKNSINGSMNQVTKSDGALITFTSSGDALTLRFLGGKKRGSFSIYVNGKFIERVDTKRNKKTQLMKTWEGLGSGKHFIDIVAELDNGQSLALNGIQSLRT